MSVTDLVAPHTPFFRLHRQGEGVFLLVYAPYRPYLPNGRDYVDLDAYYPASNALYARLRTLEGVLADYGAKAYFGDLRALYLDAKMGYRMANRLVAIPPYGTRVCLGALTLERVDVPIPEPPPLPPAGGCTGCGRCRRACPAGALTPGGFAEAKCLRSVLNAPGAGNLLGLGGNVGGCDACQRACPRDPDPVPCPEPLRALLALDALGEMLAGGKRALEPLRPYLGANYLRPRRLALLFLNALEAKGRGDAAAPLLHAQHEEVREYAAKLLANSDTKPS